MEAPSTACKRIQKKRAQSKVKRPPRQAKPFIKKEQRKSIPKRNSPVKRKKP